MKEIYLLNKGDSVGKLQYELNTIKQFQVSNNKVLEHSFVTLEEGNDDIVVVRNYTPYIEYKMKKNETLMDIMARGFEVGGASFADENDCLILSKPRSIRYVVQPLERLSDIANKFNMQKEYIMEINNLNTDKLFVGQILWL